MKIVDARKDEGGTFILRYLTILSATRIVGRFAVQKTASILESYGFFEKRKMNISKADANFD